MPYLTMGVEDGGLSGYFLVVGNGQYANYKLASDLLPRVLAGGLLLGAPRGFKFGRTELPGAGGRSRLEAYSQVDLGLPTETPSPLLWEAQAGRSLMGAGLHFKRGCLDGGPSSRAWTLVRKLVQTGAMAL
jgi:hypothetical protein